MDPLTDYIARQYDCFQTTLEKVNKQASYLNYGYRSHSGQSFQQKQEELCRQVFQLADIQSQDVIVDVGFGSGKQDFLLLAQRHFQKLIGFNISGKQVKNARKLAKKKNLEHKLIFHQLPAEDMSVLEDASVDKLISIECAFCFDRPRFYQEASRVLKSDGRMALADICFNDRLAFLSRHTEYLRRVGAFSVNKETWEKSFKTVSIRSIRKEVLSGAQTAVFFCISTLFYHLSLTEICTWLKMACSTQFVVIGLLTGLIRYDLILLEKSS